MRSLERLFTLHSKKLKVVKFGRSFKERPFFLLYSVTIFMANLQDLEITNGKDFVQKQKELEELLGINKISPFGTYELEVFEENLKSATHADLQKLAQRVGLNPFLDKSRLKGSLTKEFIAYSKNMRRGTIPQAQNQLKLDPKNPQHAEILRILGEF